MGLGDRVRAGIAVHAAVNVVFGLAGIAGVVATHPDVVSTGLLRGGRSGTPVVADLRIPLGERSVSSTAYCLQGTTASGQPVGAGIAAMDDVPFGTHVVITDGPGAGLELVVTDRTDQLTELDIWMPSCAGAVLYGRHQVTVDLFG